MHRPSLVRQARLAGGKAPMGTGQSSHKKKRKRGATKKIRFKNGMMTPGQIFFIVRWRNMSQSVWLFAPRLGN